MLSVDLISEETDLDSVREQFESNASLAQVREMQELVPILFAPNSPELSDQEILKIEELQNGYELFFHEDADAVAQVRKIRQFGEYNPESVTRMQTLFLYVVGEDVPFEDAKEAKRKMQKDGDDLELRIPDP